MTLRAEGLGIDMAAAIRPEVEDAASLAQGHTAAVAQHRGNRLSAVGADLVAVGQDHDASPRRSIQPIQIYYEKKR